MKFLWREKSQNNQLSIEEENKVVGLKLTAFKTSYNVTVIKTVEYWWNNWQIEQWNRIESPDVGPHKYSQLISGNRVKAVFSTNSAGTSDITSEQWVESRPKPYTLHQIETDHRPKCKPVEPLEENVLDLGNDNHSLHTVPQSIKDKLQFVIVQVSSCERYCPDIEKASHKLEENICKRHFW